MTQRRHMTRRRDMELVRACSRQRFTDSPVLKMPKRSSSHAPMRPLSVAAPGRGPTKPHHASKRDQTLAQKSAGEVKAPPRRCFRGISTLNATATHCMHSDRTPGGVPAGNSTNAGAIDHVITGTASMADLRDHTVRRMKRRRRHGLRRCCDGQGKSNSDEPNHCFLRVYPFVEKRRPATTRGWTPQRLWRACREGKTGTERTTSTARRGDCR
jgi:hypothetical protein